MKRLHIDFTLPEKEIGGSGEIAIAGDVEYSDLDSFLSESAGNFTVHFGSAGHMPDPSACPCCGQEATK